MIGAQPQALAFEETQQYELAQIVLPSAYRPHVAPN